MFRSPFGDLSGIAFAFLLLCSLHSPSAAQSPDGAATPNQPAEPTDAPQGADLSEANRLVREQDYATAEELLADLVETHPEDGPAWLMYGEVLLTMGVADEAKPALQKAANLLPEQKRIHFQLASALAALGEADAAVSAFGRELELNDDPQIVSLARMNRALLFQQAKRWKDAAAEVEAFLVLRPDATDAWGDLATTYVQAGDLNAAEDALSRAEAAGFVSANHYFSIGAGFYRNKAYGDAERTLRRALELDPQLADAERSLGATLEQLGRSDEARAHLRRYLELKPDAKDRSKILEQIGGS